MLFRSVAAMRLWVCDVLVELRPVRSTIRILIPLPPTLVLSQDYRITLLITGSHRQRPETGGSLAGCGRQEVLAGDCSGMPAFISILQKRNTKSLVLGWGCFVVWMCTCVLVMMLGCVGVFILLLTPTGKTNSMDCDEIAGFVMHTRTHTLSHTNTNVPLQSRKSMQT